MRELVSIKFCSIARVTRFEYSSIHFLNYFGYYSVDRFRRTILETNFPLLSNPSLRPAPLEQESKGRDPITHYRHTLLSTPNFQLKGNGYSSPRRWKPAPRSRRNKSRAIEEDNNPTPLSSNQLCGRKGRASHQRLIASCFSLHLPFLSEWNFETRLLTVSFSSPLSSRRTSRWSFTTRAGLVDGPLLIRTGGRYPFSNREPPISVRDLRFLLLDRDDPLLFSILVVRPHADTVPPPSLYLCLGTDGASKMLSKLWLRNEVREDRRELWSSS